MTETQALTLRLASAIYRHEAVRDQHVREQLGWSTVRFWREVRTLLTDPAVEAERPQEVRRLRRMMAARAGVRTFARLGTRRAH